jgi:cysteinyl-tRNA synthetase
MARAFLGDEIDLHSGGEDNIFPHHECEIAQSCCATGHPVFARAWFHTRHLQVEGEKMSKSKGNFFTARDLFARGVTPAALRLELVRTHYRTNANFTMQGLQDCQRMVDRWCRTRDRLEAVAGLATGPDESCPDGPLEYALRAFTEALCDDLNVARALAALNEACGAKDSGGACPHRELASLLAMDSVLGVLGRNCPGGGGVQDDPAFVAEVERLLAARTAARAAKDWPASDRVRDELARMGVVVKDGRQGATWSRAKG